MTLTGLPLLILTPPSAVERADMSALTNTYTPLCSGEGRYDIAEGQERLVDGLGLLKSEPNGIGLVHLL